MKRKSNSDLDASGIFEFVRRMESQYPQIGRLIPTKTKLDSYAPPGEHELGVFQNKKPATSGFAFGDLHDISKDYVLLTLAPVYVIANIPFDIPTQIASELNRTFNFKTFDTGRPFFFGLNEWNTLIEGVVKEEWDVFLKNVLSISILQRQRTPHQYWEIINQVVRHTPTGSQSPLEINVFMPTGIESSSQVSYSLKQGKMYIVKCSPLKSVVQRGRKILSL